MSVSFNINSSSKSYDVEILQGLLQSSRYQPAEKFVLVDALVLELYPFLQSEKVIAIPAVEESKSLETVAMVIERLRSLGANRSSHLIAIGGGIIQDIATFAASVFMRGISWSYYPTTLLGMADSCVGGKSSINVGQYKNIAGNFYPPDEIVVDTDFVKTLEHAEVVAGLCEAVKICFADPKKSFDEYYKLTNQDGLVDGENLAKVINLSLFTKKRFIEEDEFDEGVRLHLNFGHTFGHAIEAAGNFSITHGVAVGLGMQMALVFSGLLNSEDGSVARVQKLNTYLSSLLNTVEGLPENLRNISADDFWMKFQSDKKHTDNEYVVIIPNKDGFLVRQFIEKSPFVEQRVVAAFEVVKGFYEV